MSEKTYPSLVHVICAVIEAIGEDASEYDTAAIAQEVSLWQGKERIAPVLDEPMPNDEFTKICQRHRIGNARKEWAENCEGNYAIEWSDGSKEWPSNIPSYVKTEEDLFDRIKMAYQLSTDTHVPHVVHKNSDADYDVLTNDPNDSDAKVAELTKLIENMWTFVHQPCKYGCLHANSCDDNGKQGCCPLYRDITRRIHALGIDTHR